MSKPRTAGAAAAKVPVRQSLTVGGEHPHSAFIGTSYPSQRTMHDTHIKLTQTLRKQNRSELIALLKGEFYLTPEKAAIIGDLLLIDDIDKMREAALFAVSENNKDLTVAILVEIRCRGYAEDAGCQNSAVFQPHTTPIILACIRNQFSLVEMFLRRGHTVPIPHRVECKCVECKDGVVSDKAVQECVKRIDMYRAICSSAYIWFASYDPILRCFELIRDLGKCAKEEPNFKVQYVNLEKQVQKFCRRVAQQCWSTEDIAALLDRDEGTTFDNNMASSTRLQLALDCHAKEFLSDLNVQALLTQRWIGKWSWYDIPVHTILYPITSLIYIFSLGRYPKSFKRPSARFASYTFTYVLFLLSLYAIIQFFETPNERGFPTFVVGSGGAGALKIILHVYVWTYVWGMIFWDFRSFAHTGLSQFFDVWWHWFDFVMWCLYMIAFVCLIRAETVSQVENLTVLGRTHWLWYDPMLVYEALFSAGVVVSFWRVFFFMQMSRLIGPTVISIGCCVKNVCHYLLIMMLVIWSFAVGVNFMYEPYKDNTAFDNNGDYVKMPFQFTNLFLSVRSLYWAFYGYLQPYEQGLVVGDIGPYPNQLYNEHEFTKIWAEGLLAIYHVVLIIVLLNLMISLLVKTADVVLENEDLEWKYVRAHIWAEFTTEQHAVPPPFNVLHWIVLTVANFFNPKTKFGFPAVYYTETEQDESSRATYQELMLKLYQRYTSVKIGSWKTAAAVEAEKDHAQPSSIISTRQEMQ